MESSSQPANNQAMYPRTPADVIAEQRADHAAAEGAWGEWAHPGFEESAGHIALEATAKLMQSGNSEAVGAVKVEHQISVPDVAVAKPFQIIDSNERLIGSVATDEGILTVTDKRRVTPQSVEADFQTTKAAEEQAKRDTVEALRQPLTTSELRQAVNAMTTALASVVTEKKRDTKIGQQAKSDMDGDVSALHRLRQLVNGETIARGRDDSNKYKGLSITDRLDDLVKQYAQLIPENFRTEGAKTYIGSMGGTVEVAEDGQVHRGGYNGSLLYDFARARQVWATVESDPQKIREEVLSIGSKQNVDVRWITETPVIVTPADSNNNSSISV